MLLQFFSARRFLLAKKDVTKVIKGTTKNTKGDVISVGNKDVVDVVDAKAKFFLKHYPNECETWGDDAVKKQPVIKGRNARTPKGSDRDLV